MDGRTMEMRKWFRTLFLDSTGFIYNDKSDDVVVITAKPRSMTLGMINNIVETMKLNAYIINGHNMQFRASSHASFVFYLLLEKVKE